jgi:general secretion pathway protein D
VDSNTGDVTFDFQYYDVGVKLDALPVINMHDEITLKLTLEVSAIGENINTPENPQFPIRTRTAQSVLTLRDSETVILGGLIQDDERRAIRKIPLIGDFPAMGSIFSNRDQQDTKRDVLMVITPLVVRSQEVPTIDATEIWSGSADRWSIQKPFEVQRSQEKSYRPQPREGLLEHLEEEAPTPAVPQPPQPLSDQPAPPAAEPVAEQALSPAVEPVAVAVPDTAPDPLMHYGLEWPEDATYSIHVGSYLDRKEAEKRARQLASLEYQCFLIPAQIPRKGFFHRIYIGAYQNKSTAEEECRRYRERREFSRDIHVVDRQWAIGI